MNQLLLPPALVNLLPAGMHGHCAGSFHKKGEHLFKIGQRPEWMFYVVSGEVTLERMGVHGEPVVLQRTRQGFVSEASLKTSAYHCDALAITDSTLIKLLVQPLRAALECDPVFANRWINMLTSEVRRLRLHCERLSMKSVKDRLVHLIQTEGIDGRYAVSSGIKTLAGELAVTHEALYRAIAELQTSGRIEKANGFLMLLTRSSMTRDA